jgi:molybdenum cofactor biosynthesis protein B
MMSETAAEHKAEAPKTLNFALMICSSSRYEKLQKGERFDDASGDLIVQTLKRYGHRVVSRKVLPDDRDNIQRVVMKALKSRKVDVVITCGGTGISMKDVTIEAVRPILDKEIEGFGEIFRYLSYEEIGSAAVLTRALAGVSAKKVIFCIPGSPQSVSIALEKIIIPEAGHILKHIRES